MIPTVTNLIDKIGTLITGLTALLPPSKPEDKEEEEEAKNIEDAIKKLENAIKDLEKDKNYNAGEDLFKAYEELDCKKILEGPDHQSNLIYFCNAIWGVLEQVV